MPAVVEGPNQQRFDQDVPKDLHGIVPVKWYMCQCVDPKGFRRIVLVVRVPSGDPKEKDKLFTLPQNTWDEMGVLPDWLLPQVEEQLFPEVAAEKVKAKKSKKGKKSKTEQLDVSPVDVMGDDDDE